MITDRIELCERLNNENDGDQSGKGLLRETRDESDECRSVRRHKYHEEHRRPHTDPKSGWQIFPIVASEE